MSERIASKWKWGGALLLGIGAVAVAGGIALAVYYVRNRRHSVAPARAREQPAPPSSPVLLPVQEDPVVATREAQDNKLPTEPYRPQLDHYGVHTMQDFPFKSLQSDTYKGVHDEVLHWVKPLHYHPRLQGAFLHFAQPPKLMEKLELLSQSLQQMANALSTNTRIPQNEHKELVPVLDELSHDPGIKLDQIKSLVIVCEAMKEFPRHIVELCIKTLNPNKRQRLIEFIWCIPYGTNKKVFTDPDCAAIFMDSDLQPIMKRIGFKKETFSSDLIWDSPDDDEEDRLGAALFLLEGSHKKYMY